MNTAQVPAESSPDALSGITAYRWPLQLAALLLGGIALALLVSTGSTDAVDEAVLKVVQDVLPGSYRHVAWTFNVLVFTLIPLLSVLIVTAGLLWRRFDLAAMFALTTFIGRFTALLKEIVDRPRPSGDFIIREFPGNASFPSGHAMRAMAFFGLCYLVCGSVLPERARVPAQCLCVAAVFLTGLSRVWVGVHWPTDILGAVIWGAFYLTAIWMTKPQWLKLNRKWGAEKPD